MQVYAGLEVLSAAPSAAERAAVPHHLVGVADPGEAWSVGRWLEAALAALADIGARGRFAIVVGGTGLYFRALTRGLAPAPAIPPQVRAQTSALFEAEGEAVFRLRLARIDPAAAARINPGDRQRLTRALEVAMAGGPALSELQRKTEPPLPTGAWRAVALTPPREILYGRCEARLERIMGQGALNEVRALLARRLAPNLPAMKALGVAALAEHLEGRLSLEAALARARQETRRYVKRQLTWLGSQAGDWPRIDAAEPDAQWAALTGLGT